MNASEKFVVFPLGRKRFALPAPLVTELAKPDRMQSFPHTSPLLAGVLLRRNQVLPVLDVARVIIGLEAPPRKFFLIADRPIGSKTESTAIPVSGECELVNSELHLPTGKLPHYVSGLLKLRDGLVEVIGLERLTGGAA